MKKKTAWLLVLCMIASLFSIMTPYGTINAQAEETAESSTFVHPGILHTQKSIEAVKAKIEAGDATTVAAYNACLLYTSVYKRQRYHRYKCDDR